MDYMAEAHNTMTFKKNMESLEGVTVATVYPELTSREVIVTEWIEVGCARQIASSFCACMCPDVLEPSCKAGSGLC
eukprot:1155635-Pelagomonas_calceolata.AAC.7